MTPTNYLNDKFSTSPWLVKEAAASGAELLCFPWVLNLEKVMQSQFEHEKSNIWLSLGGFQQKGPDEEHLCTTHVLVDNAGISKRIQEDVLVRGMVYEESHFTVPVEQCFIFCDIFAYMEAHFFSYLFFVFD
ncbi:deaminated glutathione amidase, chloroplastic/cytosolic-like [Aristolochia californica]|uniref:deaminated glutathione amidase, chloroplastic/cytosolic-like n=1 Tax=Aristolochia californica TaxID=171875 RepID=UPI0035D615CC